MKWLTECRQRNRYMEAYKKGEIPKEEITALLDNDELSAHNDKDLQFTTHWIPEHIQ